jgi:hypothetical protein
MRTTRRKDVRAEQDQRADGIGDDGGRNDDLKVTSYIDVHSAVQVPALPGAGVPRGTFAVPAGTLDRQCRSPVQRGDRRLHVGGPAEIELVTA